MRGIDDFPRVDQIRALEKARRTIQRCWPEHMQHQRGEVLQHVDAALDFLGRCDESRICRRCSRPFVWRMRQQQKF